MMRLPPFSYFAPTQLSEAAKILANEGPDAMLLAGGTDLLPNMKRGQQARDHGSIFKNYASGAGRLEAARVLVEGGADFSMKDSKGRTALDVASEAGHKEVAAYLGSSA